MLAALILLVGTTLNGSSSGYLQPSITDQPDPRLVAGEPLMIRSDEWQVNTSWTISQLEQGMPRINGSVPGGADMTVVFDAPATDWSVILRPHLLGHFLLDRDAAFSLQWWFPAALTLVAAWLLLITVWPQHPTAAALGAVAFGLSPFLQWWWLAGTFYPLAWALIACAGLLWILRHPSPRVRTGWAVGLAYCTAIMAIGLYPPFAVPCALVVAAFAVGHVVTNRERLRRRLRRAVPWLAGIGAGLLVMVAFVLTRLDTLGAISATVYPGDRRSPTGDASSFGIGSFLGGAVSSGLDGADQVAASPWAVNASEASTFIPIGLFLLPATGWILTARWRERRRLDWQVIALVAVTAVIAAFVFVPGWDPIARLLLLDRTTSGRLRLGFGLVSFVLMATIGARLAARRERSCPWATVALCAIVALYLQLGAVLWARSVAPEVYGRAGPWLLWLGGFVLVVVLMARGRLLPAMAVLVVSTAGAAGLVNPLYRGVYDLRDTAIGELVRAEQAAAPGNWVAINGPAEVLILRQNAVPSFAGVRAYPDRETWAAIDPGGWFEQRWNRYAHVFWFAAAEQRNLELLDPDVLRMRFDSCGSFAQEHVRHVLSANGAIDQPCLAPTGGADGYTVFRVTPP